MEATYFWDYTFPFSLRECFAEPFAKWLRCWSAWAPSKLRKKRGLIKKDKQKKKNIKEAPFLPLWSLWVTAWSAISSSPTEAVSCAAGRQPERPPAPRTLAAGAGGPCSTWPRPGMTSAGRGKWRGRGGGGTASSRRLRTRKQRAVFHRFLFVNQHLNWSFSWLKDWRGQTLWCRWRMWRDNIQYIQRRVTQKLCSQTVLNIKRVDESEKLQSILCGRQQKVNQVFNLKKWTEKQTHTCTQWTFFFFLDHKSSCRVTLMHINTVIPSDGLTTYTVTVRNVCEPTEKRPVSLLWWCFALIDSFSISLEQTRWCLICMHNELPKV